MRFYADENFPLPVVAELRRLGHDVLTAFEDGRANRGISDGSLLSRAAFLDRAVLTINRRDFKRLHEESTAHAGMILCTFDMDFQGQAQRIHEVCLDSDLPGTIISVNRPG